MLRNYLNIAIRNLWRTKGFSFINITGLAVGMASAILIFLWIYNELSYDQFHKNKDTYIRRGIAVCLIANFNAGILRLKFLVLP